jgi:hypothetical protein
MTCRGIALASVAVATFALTACVERPPGTPLGNAAREGDLEAIERLLAAGADINEPSYLADWPPVIHAIHKRQRDALVRLLERGASLEGSIGEKALFMASGYGEPDILDVLLTRGVPLPSDPPTAASLVAAAVGGAWDFDYEWSGCDRHTAVARLLVARDPDLRSAGSLSPTSVAGAKSTLEHRFARLYARFKDCDELLRVVTP